MDRNKEYHNLLDGPEKRPDTTIPAGTMFEYNKKQKIKTEICIPLKSRISDRWTRTAGVLNIELAHMMSPSNRARKVVFSLSSVIQQVQTRLLALQSAEEWSDREMRELRNIGTAFEQDARSQPSLVLSSFVVRPFQMAGGEEIYKWIKMGDC